MREGLLPPGVPTARNQAEYGAAHLRRMRLIRAFATIAKLDLSVVRRLLAAIDDDELSLEGLYDAVDEAVFATDQAAPTVPSARAADEADELFEELGWQVGEECSARHSLVRTLSALHGLGCESDVRFFVPFARAAGILAEQELDLLPDDPAEADHGAAVARTILFDAAFAALRRMARQQLLSRQAGGPVATVGGRRTVDSLAG